MIAAALLAGCRKVTYVNPIPVKAGDPFLLVGNDGTYYLYGTTTEPGFRVFSSTDLREWKDEGFALDGSQEKSWAEKCYWAPEVYERDGRYYMFYSADWLWNPNGEDENFRIGVAVSDDPKGPFINMSDKPLYDPGFPIIDANVLFDDNGKTYLYFSRCCYKNPVESDVAAQAREKGIFDVVEESWVYGIEMAPDFSGVIGEPVLLLRPPVSMDDPQCEWESRSVTSGEVNRRWTEGSFIFKDRGRYYIMYSANFFGGANYAVGYATSDNPLGPFIKSPDNPVLQKNGDVKGTGHCMVAQMRDGSRLCVYHGRTGRTGGKRVVFFDPLEIGPDGRLSVDGPSLDIEKTVKK